MRCEHKFICIGTLTPASQVAGGFAAAFHLPCHVSGHRHEPDFSNPIESASSFDRILGVN